MLDLPAVGAPGPEEAFPAMGGGGQLQSAMQSPHIPSPSSSASLNRTPSEAGDPEAGAATELEPQTPVPRIASGADVASTVGTRRDSAVDMMSESEERRAGLPETGQATSVSFRRTRAPSSVSTTHVKAVVQRIASISSPSGVGLWLRETSKLDVSDQEESEAEGTTEAPARRAPHRMHTSASRELVDASTLDSPSAPPLSIGEAAHPVIIGGAGSGRHSGSLRSARRASSRDVATAPVRDGMVDVGNGRSRFSSLAVDAPLAILPLNTPRQSTSIAEALPRPSLKSRKASVEFVLQGEVASREPCLGRPVEGRPPRQEEPHTRKFEEHWDEDKGTLYKALPPPSSKGIEIARAGRMTPRAESRGEGRPAPALRPPLPQRLARLWRDASVRTKHALSIFGAHALLTLTLTAIIVALVEWSTPQIQDQVRSEMDLITTSAFLAQSEPDRAFDAAMKTLGDGYIGLYLVSPAPPAGPALVVSRFVQDPGHPVRAQMELPQALLQGLLSLAAAAEARGERPAVELTWSPSGRQLSMDGELRTLEAGQTHLFVRGTQTQHAIFSARRSLIIAVCVAVPAILALGAIMAFLLGHALVKPIRRLHATMDALSGAAAHTGGKGERPSGSLNTPELPGYGKRATVESGDEIGRLAIAFNNLIDRVEKTWREIRGLLKQAAIEEFRARQIMDTANDAVVLINGDSTILSVNGTLADVFGLTPEEAVGKNVGVLMPKRYAEKHDDYVKRYLETGEAHILGTIREVEALHKDGHEFPVELSMSEMVIGDEHFFVGMLRDISARKDMEQQLRKQRSKTLALLRNMLPPRIAQRLMDAPQESIADRCEGVTVLFADLVGFTPLAGSMDAGQLVSLLNAVFSEFDLLAAQYGVEKIKTIGDAIMCAAGLRDSTNDETGKDGSGVERMARLALDMHEAVERRRDKAGRPLQLRIGIHYGTVVAGVIGKKKFLFDLWGDDVNIASRLESSGEPGRTQISEAVCEQLDGSPLFAIEERGMVKIKGKGEMKAFFLSQNPAIKNRRPSAIAALVKAHQSGSSMSQHLASINRTILEAWHELRDVAITAPSDATSVAGASVASTLKAARAEMNRRRLASGEALDYSTVSVFELRDEDGPGLFRRLLEDLGLNRALGLDMVLLEEFATTALRDHRDVPYHNALHALDVALTAHAVLKGAYGRPPSRPSSATAAGPAAGRASPAAGEGPGSDPEAWMSAVDQLATMLAALCHDLDHPGLLGERPDLSEWPLPGEASDPTARRPLEAHHARRCVRLLEKHLHAIAPSLIDSELLHVQRIALDSILDTNMEVHDRFMGRFRARFGPGRRRRGIAALAADVPLGVMGQLNVDPARELPQQPPEGHEEDGDPEYTRRQLLVAAVLKVADLGNAARPFEDARRWARRITLELRAGPPDPNVRDTEEVAEGPLADASLAEPQSAFLTAVALPLFEAVAGVLPQAMRPLVERTRENVARWSAFIRR